MPVPALMSAAPLALDLLRILVEADSNAKAHEIALIEKELDAMRINLESARIEYDRDVLRGKIEIYSALLNMMGASFDRKADLFKSIEDIVLYQYKLDKEIINEDRKLLRETLRNPDATSSASAAARRELATINDRERELELRFGELMRQFQETILALSPSDYSQVRNISGYLT